MSKPDLAIGILAGIAIGLAIIAVFVFVFSGETVDAPSIDRASPASQQSGR
jgi:hypothetical protein